MIIDYATDTYAVLNFNENEIFDQFAKSGRFITAYIGKIIKILNISENGIYIGSSILAIIFVFFSIIKLYIITKKDIKNRLMQILIPIFIIINPFSIELWLYIEKGIMWLGVYLSICGLEQLIKYYENKNNKNILFSMIFIFLANCSYQGVVGVFISISLIYIVKYSKRIKEFITNNFIVAGIYGIPAILNLLCMKVLYPSNRISGQIILSESINKIIDDVKIMIFNTFGILPKNLFFLCIFFTFGLFCCKIIMGKNVKNRIIKILLYKYILLGTIIITVLPQIIQPTKSIWLVPRNSYPFGSILGILLLYSLTIDKSLFSFEQKNKTNKIEIILIIILSLIIAIPMLNSFYKIIADRYRVNQKDKKISIQILNKIKDYEKQTGNIISKIEIYEDKNLKFTYDDIFVIRDINIKAYYADWSTKEILEYYLKRKLKKEEKNNELENYFLEKNWEEFNINEQILLKEDRIIICKY